MKVEVLGKDICVDGTPLSHELSKAFVVRQGQTFQPSLWPEFDPQLAERMLGPLVDAVCAEILQLMEKGLVQEAVAFSDKLFEAFTPPMHWLFEMARYSGMDPVWEWALDRTDSWEEAHVVEYGKGIHKGTAFYFQGISRLLSSDWEGAYLSFGDAEREDQYLPPQIFAHHSKAIPPVVKLIFLDLSPDHFAYPVVERIHRLVQGWETKFPGISSPPALKRIGAAIDAQNVPRPAAMATCFALAKAFALENRRVRVRPTPMAMLQAQTILLTFNRALEDLIRTKGTLGKDDKVFGFCQKTWFASEAWGAIPGYDGKLGVLVADFLSGAWGLSREGTNMVLSLKLRNAIAHGIPSETRLVENFPELVLGILTSFAEVCDRP